MGGRAVRLGWLALLVGPPAIAWAVWERQVTAHPLGAAFIAVGYEAILAITGFFGGVAKDLGVRWRARLVERIDRSLSRIFSRFSGRYLGRVVEDLRFIDQKGFGTVGPFTPRLDEVFIDVSLAFQAPHQISAGLLSGLPTDRPERRALGDFLDRQKPVVLAVVGAPGSGKTTLLRNTARLTCTTRRRQRKVPILLYLRDHVADITGKQPLGLADAVRSTLKDRAAQGPAGWFEKRLTAGDCVVLLDGLDEVADGDDRRKVAAWVESQIKRYPKNDYVITARPLGYQAAPVGGALVLQVLGFTSEQVNQFVRSWYLAAERFSAGDDSQQTRRRAADGAADLLDRLDKAPALYELTTNPLLLTMIANVHKYRGQLPGSRAELYGEICQVLLWRRQEAKRLPAGPGPAREAVLRSLAYEMMHEHKRDVAKTEVLDRFGKALQRMAVMQTAEEFLADVASSGLLVERDPGLYCFAHQTLQEYLAAAHIHDKNLAYLLKLWVDDDWWRETTLLYVANADADAIVRACLSSGGATALALAFGCSQEARDIDPVLRQELDGLLAEAGTAETDPERRRMLTGVLLVRHLEQQVTTQSGGRVCPHPLRQSLYWLFLQDTGNPAPDSLAPGQTSERPAVGMRAEDAEAFVRWQNGIIGSEQAFRLPTLAEISDASAHRLLLPTDSETSGRCVWIGAPHQTPELWIPKGGRDPRAISRATVAAAVRADIANSPGDCVRILLLRAAVTARLLSQQLRERKPGAVLLARQFSLVLVRVRTLSANTGEGGHHLDLDRTVDIGRALLRRVGDVKSEQWAVSQAERLDAVITKALESDVERCQFWSLIRPVDFRVPVAGELELNFAGVMGRLVSQSLLPAITAAGDVAFDSAFSAEFCAAADLGRARGASAHPRTLLEPYIISLGDLDDRLVAAADTVRRSAGTSEPPSDWARETARRLLVMTRPILRRTGRTAPKVVGACRLTSLCLAAETAAIDSAVSSALTDVAAGLTLLQQRASGKALATETILLARA
jgi:NACHT domain